MFLQWKNLSVRLPFFILTASLLPLMVFGYFALDFSRENLRATQHRASLRTARLAATLITKAIDETQTILANAGVNLNLLELKGDDLEWALSTILEQNASIDALALLDSGGREKIRVAVDKVFLPEELKDLSADPAYLETIKGLNYVSQPILMERGYRLQLAIPLKDPATLRTMSVLVADVDPTHLFQALTDIRIGENGQVYILDRKGNVIAHRDPSVLVSGKKSTLDMAVAGQVVSADSDDERYLNPQGVEVFGTFATVAETGWIVIAERPVEEVLANSERLGLFLKLLFLGVVVFSVPIAYFFTRRITSPLQRLAAAAEKIGAGEFGEPIPVGSDDEIGRSARAFNRMTENLCQLSAAAKRNLWLKDGLALVEVQQRGTPHLEELARNLVSLLAGYLKAEVGALYVNDGADRFVLAAGYARTADPAAEKVFAMGEGLVGQAAAEKRPLELTDLPDNYLRIESGLGAAKPKAVFVQPLLHDNIAVGVLELGSFNAFTDDHRAFLAQVSLPIAMAINAARSRKALQEALEESQQLAEELQSQQEELRAANEELEEQTQQLQASEEQLRSQQEELQAANEELEEKALSLEEQQSLLAEKNQSLTLAREHLEKTAKELETASKYKSEFLANMSHELRTPLNSLLILAQDLVANRHGRLSDSDVEAARVIHGSGADLLTLINEILDLSKIEAGKMELSINQVPLADVVARLQRSFRHVAIDKGLSFEAGIEPGLPEFVTTDFQRLDQILKNLISNALKFTPAGGVTVRIYQPDAGATPVCRGVDPSDTFAIAITDTGIGIPADRLEDIFGAFQQVDGSISRQFGGTGLGLSISRELARHLGGGLQVSSTLDSGSTFTLYLPKVYASRGERAAETPVTASVPAPAPSAVGHEHKPSPSIPDDREELVAGDRVVLIVEDDLRFARILADLCRERQLRFLHAGDGESGVKLARQYVPAAVLLDIRLPGMHGLEVLQVLKDDSRLRHIPVHVISVEDRGTEAISKGAVGFMSKPTSREDLARVFGKLEEVMSGRIRKLLVVEDNTAQQKSIQTLIGNGDVEILVAGTGGEALTILQKEAVDCVILDLKLPDMSGFDLLERLDAIDGVTIPPVIVYTGKELSREEEAMLQKYSSSIIVKGVHSPERLFDEVALFLHRVVSKLPEHKQKMIATLHDEDLRFNGKTVLLVDDDMRNIFALTQVLEGRGLHVLKAFNGRKALDLLEQEETVDLVLMDIMMPEMDGYEAMGRIRASSRYGHVPILALTAKAMQEDRQKCIEAGANDYLSKPVDIDKLFSLLRVWLQK